MAAGGAGPGATAILFQAGSCESSNSLSWSVNVSSNGNVLHFSIEAGGDSLGDLAHTNISWHAGDWHLITVTYSSEASVIFVDDARIADGDGIPTLVAAAVSNANVFSIGGNASGESLAQGQIEELAIFGYTLSDTEVNRYYDMLSPTSN